MAVVNIPPTSSVITASLFTVAPSGTGCRWLNEMALRSKSDYQNRSPCTFLCGACLSKMSSSLDPYSDFPSETSPVYEQFRHALLPYVQSHPYRSGSTGSLPLSPAQGYGTRAGNHTGLLAFTTIAADLNRELTRVR